MLVKQGHLYLQLLNTLNWLARKNCDFKLGHYRLLRFARILVELSADLLACLEIHP
jgi:hypothetical protein